MSYRDDVILRAIHQLVEALLRAVGLRRKEDLPAAEDAIGDGLRRIGLPLELVTRLAPGTLVGLVPDPALRALLAVALRELGAVRKDERLKENGQALLDDILEDDPEGNALPAEVRHVLREKAKPAP